MGGARTNPSVETLNWFLMVLNHLGWGLGQPHKPEPLRISLPSLTGGCSWVPLALPDGQTLLAVACEGELPSLSESFKSYEDLAPVHREVFHTLTDQGLTGRYLLLLNRDRAHLLDLTEEDVLLAVESKDEVDDRLLPLLSLQALSRGSLSAIPRKPLRQRAAELADWTALWSARIGGRLNLTHGMMWKFFDWLLLARVADLNGIGPRKAGRFEDIAAGKTPRDPRRFLEALFRPLHEEWNLLQQGDLDSRMALASRAAEAGLLKPCLESFALLGRGKFAADVFAEAFADEELRLKSWRASVVAGDAELPGASGEPAYWLQHTLHFDLDASGLSLLVRRADELIELLRRFALDVRSAVERGERPGIQMDLLSGGREERSGVQMDLLAGDSLGPRPNDVPRRVMGRTLSVITADPARAALARAVLLARQCEWHARLDCRDLPLARIEVEVRLEHPADRVAERPPGAMN